MTQGIGREALVRYLDEFLAVPRFRDYCPNGLQVEGSETICKIVAGVTASQALLDEAVRLGADTVLVHHGYFWRGEESRIAGVRRKRLKTLLGNDMNLLAYHLPLDAHPELGNNAQLAKLMGWCPTGNFGDQSLGWRGELPTSLRLSEFAAHCGQRLDRTPLVVGSPGKPVSRIGWCSGGGDGYFESAIAEGVDAFLSGEISESAVHLARETGVAFLACGHHATERYGIKALAGHLSSEFPVEAVFVEIDNPA